MGIIGTFFIPIKGKEEKLHIKAFTIINPVTGWFEIAQYEDKILILITKLVKTTWMSRYLRPIVITYDQGK